MEYMRLQKYLAHCGAASRRKAEEIILDGRVTVNGDVAAELGTSVSENDLVCLDGKPVSIKKAMIYIMLNKPVGYVTTSSDQFGRKKVLDLVEGPEERLYPVGRLDYNTSGLLLMTNDGELTYRMTHPKHHVEKTYIVKTDKGNDDRVLKTFQEGIVIDGRKTLPAGLTKIETTARTNTYKIVISEGRNRQIRRLFESAECKVLELKRTAVGEIKLDRLITGHWRYLTDKEIKYLKEI